MLAMVDRPGFSGGHLQSRKKSTLKMIAAEAVEMSVTNNLPQDYTNLDDLPSPTSTDLVVLSKPWLM